MIGVYQRPAPPKRPLGLNAHKTVQKPAVPLHVIEAQASAVAENILTAKRRPGRPSLNERPMTPAERQAKRRAAQARERAIEEARQIGDAHGKSHAEVETGGYGSWKLDIMLAESTVDDEGIERGRQGHVPAVKGGAPDDLQIGDEESNRRRFAEAELRRMVGEYFTSPEKSPSASWTAKHSGNNSVQHRTSPLLALSCKLCSDSMQSVEDAQDHLRVDHRKAIDEWFRNLEPRREFRDAGNFVTVVMPRKRPKPSGSLG